MKTRKDQQEMRANAIVRDQHGRPWDVILDREAKPKFTWCTPPIPKFAAPLMPPQAYVRAIPGEYGRCHIDYVAWLADVKAEHEGWTKQLRLFATRHYQGAMIGEVLKNPPADLLAMVGQAPPPLDFVKAAAVGNKWILGLTNPRTGLPYPMPAWAQPIAHLLDPAQSLFEIGEDAAEEYPDVEDEADGWAESDEIPEAFRADAEKYGNKYLDLDDAYDPKAIGGTRVATPTRRRGKRGSERGATDTTDETEA